MGMLYDATSSIMVISLIIYFHNPHFTIYMFFMLLKLVYILRLVLYAF